MSKYLLLTEISLSFRCRHRTQLIPCFINKPSFDYWLTSFFFRHLHIFARKLTPLHRCSRGCVASNNAFTCKLSVVRSFCFNYQLVFFFFALSHLLAQSIHKIFKCCFFFFDCCVFFFFCYCYFMLLEFFF